MKPDQETLRRLHAQCERFVTHHYRRSAKQELQAVADYTDLGLMPDVYGKGPLIEDFEAQIATLLGKPAAAFMPSGTMAQQIALRIWSDRSGIRNVAFHATCHLETSEESNFRLLHNLNSVLLGERYRLPTLADLQSLGLPLSTVLLELPQRTIGGALPTWEELVAITTWAREQGIRLHMDGARLWECRPYYDRDYAEIAGLFDTVYVSLYKIIGAPSGALLAGPQDVIAEARLWQKRQGGNLHHIYPLVLAAKHGIEKRLPCMPAYCAKAREVAAALSALPDISITPNPPQTNMFHLFIRRDANKLWQALTELAEEKRIWGLYGLQAAQVPGWQMTEFVVGDATLDLATEEIASLYAELLQRSGE